MKRLVAVLAVLACAYAANAQSPFTTLWDGGNQFAGNMFDLTCLNPAGISITGWDVNLDETDPDPAALANISVYWRVGTYVGHENSPDGWNELGTMAVDSMGENTPTHLPIGGLDILAGETVGIYVFVTDYVTNPPSPNVPYMNYTNIGPALPTYANADLQLDGGVGKGSPPFTGSTFSNRMWNGNIYYDVIPGPGALALLGLAGLARRRRR